MYDVWLEVSQPEPKALQNLPEIYERLNALKIYDMKNQFLLHDFFHKTQNLLIGRTEFLNIYPIENRTKTQCGHKNLP